MKKAQRAKNMEQEENRGFEDGSNGNLWPPKKKRSGYLVASYHIGHKEGKQMRNDHLYEMRRDQRDQQKRDKEMHKWWVQGYKDELANSQTDLPEGLVDYNQHSYDEGRMDAQSGEMSDTFLHSLNNTDHDLFYELMFSD